MENKEIPQNKILYTVKEAAYLLGINSNMVYSLVKKKYLPALKLGSLKIRKEALDEFAKKYEGMDLSDLDNIKEYECKKNK